MKTTQVPSSSGKIRLLHATQFWRVCLLQNSPRTRKSLKDFLSLTSELEPGAHASRGPIPSLNSVFQNGGCASRWRAVGRGGGTNTTRQTIIPSGKAHEGCKVEPQPNTPLTLSDYGPQNHHSVDLSFRVPTEDILFQ